MLEFIWKYKYVLYILIFFVFIGSLFSILNPKIFFDTERILKYADDIQIELEESFNDKNLLLLGLEFDEKLTFNKVIELKSSYQKISSDTLIKLERSIFSEKRMIFSGFFFIHLMFLTLAQRENLTLPLKNLMKNRLFFSLRILKNYFLLLK